MEYRTLGRSGLQVSVVGLGCNNFGMRIDKEKTKDVVDAAIANGINFFDTADIYGGTQSEAFLGEALDERRQNIVLATKFSGPTGEGPGSRGGSRAYIMKAVEASLRRLNTDYIDLYQYHFPDPSTPIDETLRALDDLICAGKVRYIGNSNMTGWQVVEADWIARESHLSPFVTAQNEWSLLNRDIEKELVPACKKYGIGILPYFPLASGMLTGKYKRGEAPPEDSRIAAWGRRGERVLSDRNFDIVEGIEKFAAARDKTPLDVAIGWLLAQDAVSSVIAGATKPEQIQANAAAGDFRISPEELAELDTILTGEASE
ncbi:MAG TPA: aldo/keto reductase [Dehalococcoidia bacterium]|nr:aldo/keto reductase [Dehalococcoidia bacterium]